MKVKIIWIGTNGNEYLTELVLEIVWTKVNIIIGMDKMEIISYLLSFFNLYRPNTDKINIGIL